MYSHLSYIPKTPHSRKSAKAHLGYIGQRPGKNNEALTRTLFGRAFGTYTEEQVSAMITDAPKNTLFWRLILNPDPVLENPDKSLDVRALTADAVNWLGTRLGSKDIPRDIPFVAAIHDDHSPKAHVHAILFLERQGREKPITIAVLNQFRAAVSAFAREQQRQRQLPPSAVLDLSASPALEQDEPWPAGSGSVAGLPGTGWDLDFDTGGTLGQTFDGIDSLSCPVCLTGFLLQRPNSRVIACDRCGYAVRRGVVIRQGRRKEAAARARSL